MRRIRRVLSISAAFVLAACAPRISQPCATDDDCAAGLTCTALAAANSQCVGECTLTCADDADCIAIDGDGAFCEDTRSVCNDACAIGAECDVVANPSGGVVLCNHRSPVRGPSFGG